MEGIIAIIMVFSIPIVGIWSSQRIKLAELRAQQMSQGDGNLRAELETLRQEVHALRDTATQYDLSFDTALQRMERRVETIEKRAISGMSMPSNVEENVRR